MSKKDEEWVDKGEDHNLFDEVVEIAGRALGGPEKRRHKAVNTKTGEKAEVTVYKDETFGEAVSKPGRVVVEK